MAAGFRTGNGKEAGRYLEIGPYRKSERRQGAGHDPKARDPEQARQDPETDAGPLKPLFCGRLCGPAFFVLWERDGGLFLESKSGKYPPCVL